MTEVGWTMEEVVISAKSVRRLGLLLILGFVTASHAQERFRHRNPIPPRQQWNANSGYCGEVSFISAGLYYGQYCSQFTARAIASPNLPQNDPNSQLLPGKNALETARRMRLTAVEKNTKKQHNPRHFLQWVKENVLQGYPVIICVYNNEFRLYNNTNPTAGDQTYDHVVPVNGIASRHSLDPTRVRYRPGDRILFSDNGLWGTGGNRRMEYRPVMRSFPRDRVQANAPTAPMYSLPVGARNYGVVITGVDDRDGVTIPVRVTTNTEVERPIMPRGSNRRPGSSPLTLSVDVTLPDPTVDYVLYRYDDFDKIPRASFNGSASAAIEKWDIPAGTPSPFTVDIQTRSDKTVAFRAVPLTAR